MRQLDSAFDKVESLTLNISGNRTSFNEGYFYDLLVLQDPKKMPALKFFTLNLEVLMELRNTIIGHARKLGENRKDLKVYIYDDSDGVIKRTAALKGS